MAYAQPLRQVVGQVASNHFVLPCPTRADVEAAQHQPQTGVGEGVQHRTEDVGDATVRAGTQHGHVASALQHQRQFVVETVSAPFSADQRVETVEVGIFLVGYGQTASV